ncbi:MAG: hypothetical protein JW896_10195 [Deltaproteobacteria bacterium]|nr:hypothetical protein [Deltaproteobacteria bacterium]
MNKNILWTILLSAFLLCTAQPSYGSIHIGRITYMEGTVLTYIEDEEDWMEIGSNTPVGAEDGFYTEKDAKAELVFPNDTMLRMGELTEVEILSIEEEVTEIYIRNGIVRAYSRGSDTVMKVQTAMGYVEIPPQGITDFYVDDRSAEIVALQKDILFHKTVGPGDPEIHQLRAGSNALIFSVRHVETGTVLADTPWNRWCLDRDMVLKEQAAIASPHLPSSLQVYSHELEPYGEWERIKYRGYYYWFWRPVRVSIGWTPFTTGWWNRWHREYVWVSTEPWGWCTHHYGNWINLSGAWWWTPHIHMGVSIPGISLVDLHIHFSPLFRPFWHPGRVAWISTTSHVGWIPLAPWETYYGCRKWGPRTVVVKYRDRPRRGNHINHYAYREHSVIIPQKEFRRVSPNRQHDYRKLMVTSVEKKTLLRDSKPTYGRHQMAGMKENHSEGKNDSTATSRRTIAKQNTFRPSTSPMRTSGERAFLTQEKKTTLPFKKTGDETIKATKAPPLSSKNLNSGGQESPQITTAPPMHKPLAEKENSTRQNLTQTRPERSPRPFSTIPRGEHIEKNTLSSTGNPKSGTKKSPQVTSALQRHKPVAEQEYATRQNLTQTRPEQSPRPSSILPRVEHIEKNTAPPKSGQSMKSQPTNNPQQWVPQQSRQERGEGTGYNTTQRLRRN